jgi:hypothetical protein
MRFALQAPALSRNPDYLQGSPVPEPALHHHIKAEAQTVWLDCSQLTYFQYHGPDATKPLSVASLFNKLADTLRQ